MSGNIISTRKFIKVNKLYFLFVFAVAGSLLIILSNAASPFSSAEAENAVLSGTVQKVTDVSSSNGQALQFGTIGSPVGAKKIISRSDVGPQSSTNGHSPVTVFKTWPYGGSIEETHLPRTNGYMVIDGYQFNGPIKLNTGNVIIKNSYFAPGTQTGTSSTASDGSLKCYGNNGMLFNGYSSPPGEVILEYVHINMGPTGWTNGGINLSGKVTVRNNYVEGTSDGAKVGSNSLYENNYFQSTGSGTECAPGHIDGLQADYDKVNYVIRNNVIIAGAGVTRQQLYGNICVWGAVSAWRGAPLRNSGGLVENNYCDGFGTGISMQGTDANSPHIVRNNYFGTDYRYNGVYRIRTWGEFPHTSVENNNKSNYDYNPLTGEVKPATQNLLSKFSWE